MTKRIGRCSALVLLFAASSPAAAQTAPAPSPDEAPEPEIVVTAPSVPDEAIGHPAPDIRIDPEEIATYGVTNVGDLLSSLSPQTGDKPVLLVNGKRISGGGEISQLPPEAVARIDILPPEAALAYGYRADQRVVNIVLVAEFEATTAEVANRMATEGGRSEAKASISYARIGGAGRLSFDLSYERDSALLESERNLEAGATRLYAPQGNVTGIPAGTEIDPQLSAIAGRIVTIAGVPSAAGSRTPSLSDFAETAGLPNSDDQRRYRTLLPRGESLVGGVTLNRRLAGNISATLSARYEASRMDSRFGLAQAMLLLPASNPFSPFAGDVALYRSIDAGMPLEGRLESEKANLSVALNGKLSTWTWSATGSYQHDRTSQRNDREFDLDRLQASLDANDASVNPYAPLKATQLGAMLQNRAISTGNTATGDFTANGAFASLPAGKISATLKAGIARRNLQGLSVVGGSTAHTAFLAVQTQLQGNINIPIASRRRGVLAGLGDLSLNLNGGHDHVSDVGAADSVGAGLIWSPLAAVQVTASVLEAEGLPPASQRADAQSVTPNVSVYDFATGQTVEVNRIEGGNSALRADRSRTIALNGRYRIFGSPALTFSAGYISRRTNDPVGALPAVTSAVEAAFPDRFVRGADGKLTSVDIRPINFARSDSRALHWSLFVSLPIGGGSDGAADYADADSPSSGDGPATSDAAATRGPAASRFAGARSGRLVVSIAHSWQLENRLVLRDGVPEIDLLREASVDGRPKSRHRIDARANFTKRGAGIALDASWQSGATLGGGNSALSFSSLTQVDVRLFANLEDVPMLGPSAGWARGMRISLDAGNLFDSRTRVTDASGATPLAYQAAYLDPLGRSLRLSIRKQF